MAAQIALIAHDNKKDALVNFVQQHKSLFCRYDLIATGQTGELVRKKTGLDVESVAPGPLGGDAQIATKIIDGTIAAVIFLIDSLYAQPYEPDIRALLRLCEVYNVPLAINLATAKAVIKLLGKKKTGHLIFNPVAGQGNVERELDLIKEHLQSEINLKITFTSADVNVTDQTKEIVESIKHINEHSNGEGDSFIIASGGDGTVSGVAAALINTGIPLGIIPRGTANAFSVALGIPTQIAGACQTINRGITKVVDTALCNDIPMLLLAGVGFEAEMVEKADRELKNNLGVMAYIFAGIQQAREQELFEAEIEIDSETTTMEASAITIANAAPPTSVFAQGGGQVSFTDGLLDITVASSQTALQGLRVVTNLFTSALSKNPSDNENVVHLNGESIKVTTNPPQKIVVDGEIIGTTPVEVKCLPKSLNIFAPVENS
ncbi:MULTISPECIES: methylglyoxal synthase [unclassified Synechocystis]|uniref:methylglyoxal synthase n=1 Tax=unclassified Synechocystis TaxID=2640012 RepID=UPI000428C244|nr:MULTISPECIES: methylglyoxal synthase [unclassified Synechocystis]AIE73043.1 Methylglyoxal synthase [Synechocystis sp. PCC 6714]MCT0254422.1 methylglyoxal synthase [Synechocystis sp. CS-94]